MDEKQYSPPQSACRKNYGCEMPEAMTVKQSKKDLPDLSSKAYKVIAGNFYKYRMYVTW